MTDTTARETFTAIADRMDARTRGDIAGLCRGYADIAGDLPLTETDLARAAVVLYGAHMGLAQSVGMAIGDSEALKGRAFLLLLFSLGDSPWPVTRESLERALEVWGRLSSLTPMFVREQMVLRVTLESGTIAE